MRSQNQLQGIVVYNPLAERIAAALDNQMFYGRRNPDIYHLRTDVELDGEVLKLDEVDISVPDQPPSLDTYRQLIALTRDPSKRGTCVRVGWSDTMHAVDALARQATSYDDSSRQFEHESYLAVRAKLEADRCRRLAIGLFNAGWKSTERPTVLAPNFA